VLRRRFAERVFKPAVKEAGLDPSLAFHDLRHAAIPTQGQLGVHPRVMQGRAGRATAKLTLELYAHFSDSGDRQAVDALNRHFRSGDGSKGAQAPESSSR
jgi:integrase